MSCYGYELTQCGYKCQAPSLEVMDIDAPIAEGIPCSECGGQMHYEAYTSPTGSYIALAVCNKCGHEVEF